MGLARTVFIVGIQNSVEWKMRGVATASNMFMNILILFYPSGSKDAECQINIIDVTSK